METKDSSLIASAMLLISSGLVPPMPEETSQHVSDSAGTSGSRNGAMHPAAPQCTDKREHHTATERGDSSSHLSMAAREISVPSSEASLPTQDSHLMWEHSRAWNYPLR